MGPTAAILAFWFAYLSADTTLTALATAAGWNGTSPWILMPQQRYVATYPSLVIGFDSGDSALEGDDYSMSKWTNGMLTNEIALKMGDLNLDPIGAAINLDARLRQLVLGDPATLLKPLVGRELNSQYNITQANIKRAHWLPVTDNTYQRIMTPVELQINDYTL